MNEFLSKLKRLFEPRPPAETMGEPTADRPPPPIAEAPPVEAAPPRAEAPPRPVEAAPPRAEAPPRPVEAAPPREPAALAAEDLAEVRAALEAVAEVPVPAPEPEPLEPEAEVLPPAAQQEPVEEPAPAVDRVGDALVLTLGTPPATFTVAKTSATLGRGQENTIRLDDLSVSRRHARIVYRQGGYWLSDLGSMGGTWVDGTRLSAPHRVAAGQVIDIGLCRLTVDAVGGAATAETKRSANAETRKANASRPRSEIAAPNRKRR
jgi:hypothetical protein